MESGADWAASTQFSPSKAQAQQAQAKDWASVDAWLSRRYAAKRLPAFERNEETLQVLLTLATLNESADEQRGHIDRIEKATLSANSKRSSSVDEMYHMVLSALDDQEDLNALAQAVVCLNCSHVDISAVAAAIVDLTSRGFTVDQQIRLLDSQMSIVKSEQLQMTKLLDDFKQDHFQAPADLAHETSECLRSAKHMRAKIAEYDDRLNGLHSTQASQSRFESVIQEAQGLNTQLERLTQLHAELNAYQSLPANVKAAHSKLESARENLLSLTKERDRLFEQLADSG